MSESVPPLPSPLARAKPIFLAVRELASPLREEELERLCQGDESLRRVVDVLLAGERAPLRYETIAEEIVAARAALPDGGGPGFPESVGGTRIGPYRVLEKIGEGGFGVVYMAEQEEPVRRRVALKILKLGMDTRQIVGRFEAERQALALMDHPAIARVFDAGATHTGRPYFVMELVRGEPITAYCDRRALTIPQRLSLFEQVCAGVHHAHQKGVIHRDIKPDNILIAEFDGRPCPKILDFGIAKATSARLTEKTVFTEFRQMIGTPEYMSPEQAERGHGEADVDTRTDVYSLGVVLYELLAGAPPFDPARLRSAAYAEMQRIIREEDPPRPSTRLSTLAALPSVAACRTVDPTRLAPLLKGELDWVVMKCLEKERGRRYGSAADLGADLGRILAHEPVTARPASRAYLVRKFVRRNRPIVATAAVFTFLLVAGAAGTAAGLVSAVRANADLDKALTESEEQRDIARTNERRATTQLLRSEQLTQFLRSMLKAAGPAVMRGRDATVLRELVDAALARIDSGELKAEPIVEAQMRAAIAETFQAIGDNTAALRVIEPAIRLADAAPEDEQPFYLSARVAAVSLYTEWRRDDEALAQIDRYLRVREQGGIEDDAGVPQVYTNYAALRSRRSDFAGALEMFERARAANEKLHGKMSPNVAVTISNIAGTLTDMGRYEEALANYEQTIPIYRALTPEPLLQLAVVQNNMAGLLVQMGRFADAEKHARESLGICARIFKPNHQQAGMSWHTLGGALSGLDRHEEASEAFRNATEILAAAFNDTHPFVSTCRISFARELVALRRYAEAQTLLLAAHEAIIGTAGPASEQRSDCVAALVSLYAAWDVAEPRKGYAEQAEEWRRPAEEPAPSHDSSTLEPSPAR